MINGISYPISIRKCTKNKRRLSSRKDHERECPLGFEECAEQQHSESIVEQTDTGSLGRQILAHLVNSIENVWTSDSEIN